jgi:hypothetical protein
MGGRGGSIYTCLRCDVGGLVSESGGFWGVVLDDKGECCEIRRIVEVRAVRSSAVVVV